MSHVRIEDVRLLPPGIPVPCGSCRHPHRGEGRFVDAKHWAVSPDGLAITRLCEKHGEEFLREGMAAAGWTLHDIHHDDASDNTTRARVMPEDRAVAEDPRA